MQKNKLVSIITPAFNSEKYIAETINSIAKQTYSNWEHIIIDDASTDNTVAIIKQFQKKDQRIKLIQLHTNAGSAIARNAGIKMAKGSYLTFIDADDLWLPQFIEISIKTIEKKQVPFVFASYKRLDENLNPYLNDFLVPSQASYADILKTNSISCLTAFLDTETLGKKYMPLVRKRQDMGLWLQYLKQIPFAYGIQQPLAIYRIRKNSLSRNKWQLINSQWQFYRQVEKLNLHKSLYYMACWAYYGFIKYRR